MKSTLRTDFSEGKSVFRFRVRLGNPHLDFENLNLDFPIEGLCYKESRKGTAEREHSVLHCYCNYYHHIAIALAVFACLLITMVSCRGQKNLISHTQIGLSYLLKSNFIREHPHSFYMRFDPTPLGWSYDHAVSCSNLSHGSIHVTIMENNQWRFATQFQRTLLQVADSTTVHKKKNWCHFLTLISLSPFF